jgi:hypothetical protein
MIKRFLFFAFLISITTIAVAQNNMDSTGVALQFIAKGITEDSTVQKRHFADSLFTRTLVQNLKNPFSFNYTFDSLVSVKIVTAPDKSFRFFSWQLDNEDGTFSQKGAMQINTPDGQLKLLPFFDDSEYFENPNNEISNRKHWHGAIYYDIVQNEYYHKTYYTLLGYDENNADISHKIIEVIHFENNEPVLGGDFFIYPEDESFPKQPIKRFILSYKKGSNAYIRTDNNNAQLVLSELSSIENNLKLKNTLVPNGDDLYFEWTNGKWVMRRY